MSKRYRNGFKRTLCRWMVPTSSTSYRNARPYGYNINNTPLSPTSTRKNNLHHRQFIYSKNGQSSRKIDNAFCCRHDNAFTLSLLKYRFVIGSRTHARHTGLLRQYRRRTLFHYRFSLAEQQEREEQQQQLQLQLQRNFSMNAIHQPKQRRAKFRFTARLLPPTPPNSLISESKSLAQIPNGCHSKY